VERGEERRSEGVSVDPSVPVKKFAPLTHDRHGDLIRYANSNLDHLRQAQVVVEAAEAARHGSSHEELDDGEEDERHRRLQERDRHGVRD
jgi:hypothetical protein